MNQAPSEHAPVPNWDASSTEQPDVLYFPVRHYSPASALALLGVFDLFEPTTVLIEGPSDFNDRIDELSLDHDLPIALYTWVRRASGKKLSAFYPICEFSPEWVALRQSFERGIEVKFIDLPWDEMARAEANSHRYGDGQMRHNPYPDAVAQKLGVDDFDGVWDRLFEIPELSPQEYVTRALDFCYHLRVFSSEVDHETRVREAFMAEQVEVALAAGHRVLVVTGGYHSAALWARNEGLDLDDWRDPAKSPGEDPAGKEDADQAIVATGIAVTPFSYPRIDRLSGYQSGLSGPAFYEHVWRRRRAGRPVDSTELLESIVSELRDKNQIASTADLIAVRSTAEALARMRGHGGIWRFDLLDALSASLVKEELDREWHHPVFQVARTILRGRRRGMLSKDASMPPLVQAVRAAMEDSELELQDDPRKVELDLATPHGLARSQLLHRLRAIDVAGFTFTQGVDFTDRDDLSKLREVWDLRWSPEHDATLIEAAVYGTDLEEAARNVVLERAGELEGRASDATALAVSVAQMGLPLGIGNLQQTLESQIADDGDFFSVGKAIGDLMYLFAHDEVLGTAGAVDLGEVFVDALRRGLWLFESLGTVKDRDRELLSAIRNLYRAYRSAEKLIGDPTSFIGPMKRAAESSALMPLARGAAHGALYSLDEVDIDDILAVIQDFSDPIDVGDFLGGFFSLAREAAQRDPRLLQLVDQLIVDMTEEEFLELAPALRFAFTFFTPREKHELVDILFGDGQLKTGDTFVGADTMRRAELLDLRIRLTIRDFGLRGVAAEDHEEEPQESGTSPDQDSKEDGTSTQGGTDEKADGEKAESECGQDGDRGDPDEPQDVGDTGSRAGPAAGTGPAQAGNGGASFDGADAQERSARWRLVLGLGAEGRFPSLPQQWEQRDTMLGYLYDREYGEGRNVRGANRDGNRSGGLGESTLSVPEWINGIHELFPRRTIERLERDALDRYELEEVVTRPEVLSRATPNPTLLKAVLRTKHLMDENVLSVARRMVKQVVEELFEKLAREIENPFVGALDRRRRSYRKIAKNFDAPETIRRNLKHWDTVGGRLVIHEPIFNSRVRNHADRWRVITLVDQSGSMLDSVIHAAITASIFGGIRAIDSRLVAFDTNIVDLSGDAGDPVETLMKVQLGGGTDIANALEYAERQISQPRKTIVILITDFFEGGAPGHMLAATKRLVESGVKLLGLAALDSDANPTYDHNIASQMVALGAEVGAMTPGELANWVAEKVGN